MSAAEISGIITGVFAGIVAVIGAIGKIINDKRRENGNHVCVFTGRPLKPKPKNNKEDNKPYNKKIKEIEVKAEEIDE